jgi:LysM repeat protein
VSNSANGGNWPVSDHVLSRLIELCVDICKRNGIKELNYTGDKNGNLTRHNMFASTTCPGPYLQSKFPYIASEVNKRLSTPIEKPKTYIVKKGDTLSKIASMFGTTYQELARINNISNPSLITVGQVIKLVEEVKPKEPIVETPKEPIIEPIIEPVEEPAEEHEEIPKEEPIVVEDKPSEIVEPIIEVKQSVIDIIMNTIIKIIKIIFKGGK